MASESTAPRARRVLITGISDTLAGMVARQLEKRDDVEYIVGIDVREPQHDLTRTEFVRADLRNPLVAKVISATEVDTVLHMSTASAAGRTGRSEMKERNVIGAMQLLAACQKSDHLRKFILKSSTAVYGSDYRDPAMFREEQTSGKAAAGGFSKDITEIEGYARAFARRRRDVELTVLRFANFVGVNMSSVMTNYFSMPVVPTVLGFDPRLQFCHEDDALEVLQRSVIEDHPGIYNVAGDGIMYLSQCIRLAGRAPVPVPSPLVNAVGSLVRRTGRVDFSPEQVRFLHFGRVGDLGRLRDEFGFEPAFSTRAAFEDFISQRRLRGVVNRNDAVRWERDLYDFVQRKGAERFAARSTT